MKIIFSLEFLCGPNAVVCGISKTYHLYIEQLYKKGWDIIIFSCFDEHKIISYFLSKNIIVNAYKLSSVNFLWNPNKLLDDNISNQQRYYCCKNTIYDHYTIFKALKNEKPDIIHCVLDLPSTSIISLHATLLNIPIVSVLHCNIDLLFLKPANLLCFRMVYNYLHKMISHTHDSIATRSTSFLNHMLTSYNWKFDKVIRPHVNHNIFKINNNYDYLVNINKLRKELSFNNDDAILYLYIGRVDIDKDINTLVDLLKCYPQCYLVIIGGGTLSNYFYRLHGRENRIYSIPYFLCHNDILKYYHAVDYHISASQIETLGNTAIESISSGTPVIAPKTRGFIDTIKDKQSGLLWEPNNLKHANEIIQQSFLEISNLKNTIKENYSDEFNFNYTIEDLNDWYSNVISNKKPMLEKIPFLIFLFIAMGFINIICFIFHFLNAVNFRKKFNIAQLTDIKLHV